MKRNEPKCVEKIDCGSEKDTVKLFLFCRKRFPKLSRSELRTCFAKGTIFVNDVRIRCGHDDECKRLSPGDVVTINVNILSEDHNKIKSTPLNVLHQQAGMVILHKPSGIRKSEIEKACQQRLFDSDIKADDRKSDVQFLYHLEKGLGGLIVVAESTTHLLHLRQLLSDGFLLVHYTCVISGYIGDVGTIATIPTTHQGWPTMDLKVIRTAQCRKCGLISHVRIQIAFDAMELSNVSTGATPTSYSDRMNLLRYPTARVKSIRRALQASGHIIVGDGGAIKSNKGLFASVASIQLLERPKEIDTIDESSIHRRSDHSVDGMDSVGWTGFEPFLVMLDDPKKFTTLMDKEQFLYDLAQSKQEALLHAWSIRQSTGGDCLEAGTRKVLSGTKVEHINEQEGFVLRKHEKVGDCKNVRNENSDSDEDSDNNSAQEDLEDLEGDEETGENNGMLSLQDMQRMLSEGVPVEYILEESTFCGLTFVVNRNVMIPKKSSEVLVQRALLCLQCRNDKDDVLRRVDGHRVSHDVDVDDNQRGTSESGKGTSEGRDDDDDICVLDIGTGSGCLLLSILHHYLHSGTGTGGDVDGRRGGGGGGGDDDGGGDVDGGCGDGGGGCGDGDGGDDHRRDEPSVLIKVGDTPPVKSVQRKSVQRRMIRGVGIDLSSTALSIAHRNAQVTELDHITSFHNMDFSDLGSLMVVGVANDVHVPALSSVPSPWTNVSSLLVPSEPVLTKSNDNMDARGKPPTPPPPTPPPTTTTTTATATSTSRTGRFDIIVCNPPYSSIREQRLSTTSREYEPAMALYAADKEGASGPLGAYRTLANAFIAVEHTYQQSLIHSSDKLSSLPSLSPSPSTPIPSLSPSIPKRQHLFNTDARIIFEVGCGQDLLVQQIFSKCNMFLQFLGSYKDHKGIVRCLEYKYTSSK